MSKHTPGPWTLGERGRWTWLVEADLDGQRVDVCDVCEGDDDTRTVADAHLIGAAPDLLAALVEAQKRLRGDRDAMPLKDLRPIVHAAIAKARNEGADHHAGQDRG